MLIDIVDIAQKTLLPVSFVCQTYLITVQLARW